MLTVFCHFSKVHPPPSVQWKITKDSPEVCSHSCTPKSVISSGSKWSWSARDSWRRYAWQTVELSVDVYCEQWQELKYQLSDNVMMLLFFLHLLLQSLFQTQHRLMLLEWRQTEKYLPTYVLDFNALDVRHRIVLEKGRKLVCLPRCHD